jgi:hypothetical protein
VGTSLKKGEITENPVDVDRVKEFMQAVIKKRERNGKLEILNTMAPKIVAVLEC